MFVYDTVVNVYRARMSSDNVCVYISTEQGCIKTMFVSISVVDVYRARMSPDNVCIYISS